MHCGCAAPSEEMAKAFLQDESPDATQRLVDRLLASEAYAERMAAQWLDLALSKTKPGKRLAWKSMQR